MVEGIQTFNVAVRSNPDRQGRIFIERCELDATTPITALEEAVNSHDFGGLGVLSADVRRLTQDGVYAGNGICAMYLSARLATERAAAKEHPSSVFRWDDEGKFYVDGNECPLKLEVFIDLEEQP